MLWTLLILITLLVGLCFSAYACNNLNTNLDSYIAVHNNNNIKTK